MRAIDLHTHSTKSDGSFTPTELVNYAIEKNLSAIALSDHDTTEGIDEALEAARIAKENRKEIEVIPAIEFSTEWGGRDVHILGLYINKNHPEFHSYLKKFQESRELRNEKMCKKLTEYGAPVDYKELCDTYPGAVLTRAHYAKFLMDKGYVKSRQEAFDRYVGDYAPCYIPREKITPMDAVSLILKVGGVPVLAHPILYHLSKANLEKLVSELKSVGLLGIEAVYSTYATSEEAQIRKLASQYDLLITGGSDFHGANKPGLDLGNGYGKLFVPEDLLIPIKEAHKKIKANIITINTTNNTQNSIYKNTAIFSDMDGTLLDDEKKISKEIYEKIIEYTNNGGTFVLSSGRPIGSIVETAEKLGLILPNTYIISYNGALVYDLQNKKSVYERRVSRDKIKAIMNLADQMNIHVQGYTEDSIISPRDDEEVKYYTKNIHLPVIVSEDLTAPMVEDPFKLLTIAIKDGISYPEDNEKLVAFHEAFTKEFGDTMHSFYSGVYYLELCNKEASKGNAVKALCEHLGINIKNTVAVGDAANDISMLQAAGCGVCMINGTEETKKAADYITKKDNNHNGFLEIFEQFQ